MTNPPQACARVIYWRAKPSQFDAYSAYLHSQVEPIDAEALARGALTRFMTLVDATPDAPWTHMRLFLFASHAQRDNMLAALAEAAAALMPDAEQRQARTVLAATLRDKVGEADFDVLA